MSRRRESSSGLPVHNLETDSSPWTYPKCECLFVVLTWLAGLPGACFERIQRSRRVADPILPIIVPERTSRNWFRRFFKRIRGWTRAVWKLFFQIVWNCNWPDWEPDQNSLCVRVIKASRLEGFKMAVKDGMHFAGRMMFVISYKVFTGIAIYLIIVNSTRFVTTPIVYKDAGKVPLENILFPSADVYPSHMFSARFLSEIKRLYKTAQGVGNATDIFGGQWSLEQAEKLYYYVYRQCQTVQNHSGMLGLADYGKSLDKINFHNITLQDDTADTDFQKILRFVETHEGSLDCSEMLKACRWGPDRNWNCSDIFEAHKTETGNGCRLKQVIQNGTSPSFQKVPGSKYGLTFVIIMEIDNIACTRNEGYAYIVNVHSTLDGPQAMTNGIPIAPNHEVFINVNADITLSDQEVLGLHVDTRECYDQHENFLNSTSYTESNCRTECRSLLFQQHCHCHQLGTTAGKNETICGPQHAECEKWVESNIQNVGYSIMCKSLTQPMKCYHTCKETVYNTVVSSTPYFGEPGFLKYLDLKENQVTAVVHIFFGLDSADARERKQQYDFWDSVAILVGVLSMMLGIDFMNLIHLLYALGVWIKGLWLKRKLAKSVVRRLITGTANIMVSTVSIQTTPIGIISPAPGPSQPTIVHPKLTEVVEMNERIRNIFAIPQRPEPIVVDPTEIVIPAIVVEPTEPTETAEGIDPLADAVDIDEPIDLTESADSLEPDYLVNPSSFSHLDDFVQWEQLIKNVFVIPNRLPTPVELSESMDPINLDEPIELVEPSYPIVPANTVNLEEIFGHIDPIETAEPQQGTQNPFVANPEITEEALVIERPEYCVIDLSDAEDQL